MLSIFKKPCSLKRESLSKKERLERHARELRERLWHSSPPINLGNPYLSLTLNVHRPPRHVVLMLERFSESQLYLAGYIPSSHRGTLYALRQPMVGVPSVNGLATSSMHALQVSEAFPDHLFIEEPETHDDAAVAVAWIQNQVNIAKNAADLYSKNSKSDAWCTLVKSILDGRPPPVIGGNPSNVPPAPGPSASAGPSNAPAGPSNAPPVQDTFVIHKATDDSFKRSLLVPTEAKIRADYTLHLNSNHAAIRPHVRAGISVLNNPVVDKMPTFAAVHVRSPFDNAAEAGFQAAVTGSALLRRWGELLSSSANHQNAQQICDGIPPVPVIVVLGHEWTVYWTFWVERPNDAKINMEIVQLGPYPVGRTNTLFGLYQISRFVNELWEWSAQADDGGYWGMVRPIIATTGPVDGPGGNSSQQ